MITNPFCSFQALPTRIFLAAHLATFEWLLLGEPFGAAIAAGGGGSNRNLQRVKNWDNPLASVVHFGLLFDFSVII